MRLRGAFSVRGGLSGINSQYLPHISLRNQLLLHKHALMKKTHMKENTRRGYTSNAEGTIQLCCFAQVGWDVTGYQGLFCPLNKPSCDQWLRCIQMVKSSDRGVSVAYIGHYVLKNRGKFHLSFNVFKNIILVRTN